MCGIVFKYNYDKNKPVNNDILQQYDKQSHRGKLGFGLFDGQYMNIVRESRENNILKWLCTKDSNLILFHHRFPTSTVNVARAAHPFSTHDYFGKTQYIMVHNGIIRNADEMYVKHSGMGIKYSSLLDDLTFNDSEALMWELALVLEGKQDELEVYGDMAFIVMKTIEGKLVDMFYGRNGRPLNVRRNEDGIELSSEGEGVSILPNTLYQYDFKTKEVARSDMNMPMYRPFKAYNVPAPLGKQTSLLPAHAVHDDVYDSYDDYYSDRYGIVSQSEGAPLLDRETNWERLRRKYGKPMKVNDDNKDVAASDIAAVLHREKLDAVGAIAVGQILDAKKDKNGSFFVAEMSHDDAAIDVDSIDLRDYEPTASEVQNMAMDYMVKAQGNFEDAYAVLENDYADFQSGLHGNETFSEIRQQLLMEAAMEFINSDPEYENETSVSSIWEALWASPTTVLA